MTQPQPGSDWNPPARAVRRVHIYALMALFALASGAAPVLTRPLRAAYYNLVYGPLASDAYEPNSEGTETYLPDPAGVTMTPTYEQQPLATDTGMASYPETYPPSPALESRASEAVNAGLVPVIEWHEVSVAPGSRHEVLVNGEYGATYRVLARGTPGCDVDAVISEDLKDDALSEDATLDFTISAPGQILITFPVFSDVTSSCTIGIGVYRS